MTNPHEYGLSGGMIYPNNGPGLPWPGLVKVSPKRQTDIYAIYDDAKKIDLVGISSGTGVEITSMSLPTYVAELMGFGLDPSGVLYDEQELEMFSLAYRTEIEGGGYKLTVQFNTMASLGEATHQTLEEVVTPTEFNVRGESVPENLGGTVRASRIEISTRTSAPEFMSAFDHALRNGSMTDIVQILREHTETEGRINALRSL